MLNLVLDIGNSRVKGALFDNDKLLVFEKENFSNFNYLVQRLMKDRIIDQMMVSSVNITRDEFLCSFGRIFKKVKEAFYWFDNKNFSFPFEIKYSVNSKIGADRLGLVCSCFYFYPKQNSLIIDMGTCITYDFLTAEKEYVGGQISPGKKMRYRAMHNQTKQLPLLDGEKNTDNPPYIGTDTQSCMIAGVEWGIVFEINGIIQEYKKIYPEFNVIITGGDGRKFSPMIKKSIYKDGDFILAGLNKILTYNSENAEKTSI